MEMWAGKPGEMYSESGGKKQRNLIQVTDDEYCSEIDDSPRVFQTPINKLSGDGFVRQRYSLTSEDENSEATEASKLPRSAVPAVLKVRSRNDFLFNFLWLVSVGAIVYLGDGKSNIIFLFRKDQRIKRPAFYTGLFFCFFNLAMIFTCHHVRIDERSDVVSSSYAPIVMLLGSFSFCMLSFALWPIWSFFTLLLLFTLFMAFLVTLSHLLARTLCPDVEMFRSD